VAIAEAFELEATSGPPRSSSGPRRGDGVLDADLAAGLEEGIEFGFIVESPDGLTLRHELVGLAIEADLLPTARGRYHAAVATAMADHPFMAVHHHLAALDARSAGLAAIEAADAAAVVDAPADELAALELAISVRGSVDADRPARGSRGRTARRSAGDGVSVALTTDAGVRGSPGSAVAGDRASMPSSPRPTRDGIVPVWA
jgi:hypothetical protein